MTFTEERALAAALAELPGLEPARLNHLLASRSPSAAVDAVRAGTTPAELGFGPRWEVTPRQTELWARRLERADLDQIVTRYERAGVSVLLASDRACPRRMACDIDPPAVLFVRGSVDVLHRRELVAMVGTRSATPYGRDAARSLGRDLSCAGISVVSGLAAGIDGAAHEGALEARPCAPPIAVVACGVDVVYPPNHARLWRRVAEAGAVVSECALGVRPTAGEFPRRNRLIAALARVVVVVETPTNGGSLITVRAAEARRRTIMAVPGPIFTRTSLGNNRLLDLGLPCREAADVVTALDWHLTLEAIAHDESAKATGGLEPVTDAPLGAVDGSVLGAMAWESVTVDQLIHRTGLTLAPVTLALARLELDGWVVRSNRGWRRVLTSEPLLPTPTSHARARHQ